MPLIKEGVNVPTTRSFVQLGETTRPFVDCSDDLSLRPFASTAELGVDQTGVTIELPVMNFSLSGEWPKKDELLFECPWIRGQSADVRNFREGKVRVDTPSATKIYGLNPGDLETISKYEENADTRFPLQEIVGGEGEQLSFVRGSSDKILLKVGEVVNLTVQVYTTPNPVLA